jgi:hypothetical protein
MLLKLREMISLSSLDVRFGWQLELSVIDVGPCCVLSARDATRVLQRSVGDKVLAIKNL